MTYNIQIDEYQRELLERATAFYAEHRKSELQREVSKCSVPFGKEENAFEEVECLAGMLKDMPKDSDPETVHGFCL